MHLVVRVLGSEGAVLPTELIVNNEKASIRVIHTPFKEVVIIDVRWLIKKRGRRFGRDLHVFGSRSAKQRSKVYIYVFYFL